jgi:glycosyltransferase involved in cell wall biosynthesis
MARVLVYSADVIGERMAGPGIRYWELARELAKRHEVTLAIPNDNPPPDDRLHFMQHDQWHRGVDVSRFDAILCQTLSPAMALRAHRSGTKIIVDEYDPVVLEVLERHRHEPASTRTRISAQTAIHRALCISVANSIICASEKQRDLLIGAVAALGLLTPDLYETDPTLRSYIDVVPFGLPSAGPERRGRGLRERFGIGPNDFVLLWGGGIWEWFDPLTPIRAVAELSKRRSDIKLVFMGLENPSASVETMPMTQRAIDAAETLGVKDSLVFFNRGWIPYEERGGYLLDANAGISAHFNHLEAAYAFRTRMLDYLWAELPIICTAGDSFASLVAAERIGETVPYEDVSAMVAAIERLADLKDEIPEIKARMAEVKTRFEWSEIVRPLERQITEIGGARHPNQAQLYLRSVVYFVRLAQTSVADEGIVRTGRLAARYLMKNGRIKQTRLAT